MSGLFSSKFSLRSVSAGASIAVIIGVGLLSGCAETGYGITNNSDASNSIPGIVENDRQLKIMDGFDTLLERNPGIDGIISFIDQNISGVSKENASMMIIALENAQKEGLPALDERFFNEEGIQNKINGVYDPDTALVSDNIDDIQDLELKDLLKKTWDTGYRVETAEGSYFPIINYEYLKKYSPYVTDDIKDYIDIMAVESSQVPAKDAGLVIGWDEIIRRAMDQEQFIKEHESSPKAKTVIELQRKYLSFMLYGTDNTPLFSYETGEILPEAKNAFMNAVEKSPDSPLMQMLGDYMDILDETGCKLSDTAREFRKEASKHLSY